MLYYSLMILIVYGKLNFAWITLGKNFACEQALTQVGFGDSIDRGGLPNHPNPRL
jgi:hypothetical protein